MALQKAMVHKQIRSMSVILNFHEGMIRKKLSKNVPQGCYRERKSRNISVNALPALTQVRSKDFFLWSVVFVSVCVYIIVKDLKSITFQGRNDFFFSYFFISGNFSSVIS